MEIAAYFSLHFMYIILENNDINHKINSKNEFKHSEATVSLCLPLWFQVSSSVQPPTKSQTSPFFQAHIHLVSNIS